MFYDVTMACSTTNTLHFAAEAAHIKTLLHTEVNAFRKTMNITMRAESELGFLQGSLLQRVTAHGGVPSGFH